VAVESKANIVKNRSAGSSNTEFKDPLKLGNVKAHCEQFIFSQVGRKQVRTTR